MKNNDTEINQSGIETKEQSSSEKGETGLHIRLSSKPWKNYLPWILVILLAIGILGVIFYYERIEKRTGSLGYSTREEFSIPHFRWIYPDIFWDNWLYNLDREIEYHSRRIDQALHRMQLRQKALWSEFDKMSLIEKDTIGRYQGSSIKNGEIFSYSIELGKDTITGVLSGTQTGTLEQMKNSIEKLGYKVEKKDGGYLISGEKSKIQDLFRIILK